MNVWVHNVAYSFTLFESNVVKSPSQRTSLYTLLMRITPQGYAGMGATSGGIKTGQRIWNEMMILYDLDDKRRVRVVRTYRLSGPVISGPD